MSTILIAGKQIEAEHFLSATEQEGPRWGQPVAASVNAGKLRPLLQGTPADLVYNGTATGDGAGDGTTVIDSILAIYGGGFFVDATIAITSGDCDGESQTVTDFAQATGTLTSAAFSAQIVTGVTFTLTMPYSTREILMELITSGDVGIATYKWSLNNGLSYFGRNNPNQATYKAQREVFADPQGTGSPLRMLDIGDGEVLGFYVDSSSDLLCKYSTDNGITWTTRATVLAGATGTYLGSAVRLSSGRIFLPHFNHIYFSDDDGGTWALLTIPGVQFTGFCEFNGALHGVFHSAGIVFYSKSTDGGARWASGIIVASDTNTQQNADICVNAQGNLVCVYESDEDSLNDFEIKCKISSDGGTTWGSVIAVINFTSDYSNPRLLRDIDGYLYCIAADNAADRIIVLSRSTSHGVTWSTGSILTVMTEASHDFIYGDISLIGGHEVWISCFNDTDNSIMMARRGIWEAYSGNACSIARAALPQFLVCGAEMVAHGGGGILGDGWSFEAEYDYATKNMIEDSPSRPWRSEQDGIACTIVIDLTATGMLYADGVAFFGCNLRTLSWQMNATDSWGAPTENEAISFDFATGGVLDSNSAANEIHDAALLASYKDHELTGKILRFTSGTLDTESFRITDNMGDYIFVDGDTDDAALGDTFIIYQDHISKTFTGGPYRYARISITAQNTPEGYYQIGTMIAGRAITLTDTFGIGYGRTHEYGITQIDTPAGGLIPIKDFGRRRKFKVSFAVSETGRLELLALLDYLEGSPFAMILDSTNLKDCQLVELVGEVKQDHVYLNKFALTAELQEVL